MQTISLDYRCNDCGTYHNKPRDNGDNKSRCEECSIAYYKNSPYYFEGPILMNPIKIINTKMG